MRLAIAVVGFTSLIAAQPMLGELELSKRILIPAECQNSQDLESAVRACSSLASAAARDARNGSGSRMIEFFKSDDTTTRGEVTQGFDRIAQECISTGGRATFRCVYLTGQCAGTNYYGYRTGDSIVVCDSFYNYPVNNYQCNFNTQAVNLIHEISHLDYTVASSDYNGCYGIKCVEGLSPQQNLQHADSYALFAQALNSGCY